MGVLKQLQAKRADQALVRGDQGGPGGAGPLARVARGQRPLA